MEELRFLTPEQAHEVRQQVVWLEPTPTAAQQAAQCAQVTRCRNDELWVRTPPQVRRLVGTPAFVYDWASLKANADQALSFPNAFGLTARFAMKASPNAAVLRLFDRWGLHFDCSSLFEVKRAVAAGVPPHKLSLSTQELGEGFEEYVKMGVKLNACSLSQLDRVGLAFAATPGQEVGVRFNPGVGSGGTALKTNVGGPDSSFGIWHEQADEVAAAAAAHSLCIVRVHTHIGSGSDPAVWQRVSAMSLALVRHFPSVTALNLGGGYKVGRVLGEKSTDLVVVGLPVKEAFEAFAAETGRQLHLEIEPGTFLLANAGSLVATVQDKVSTGPGGHAFLKIDSGMTEVLRPSLYGAQHPIVVVKQRPEDDTATEVRKRRQDPRVLWLTWFQLVGRS